MNSYLARHGERVNKRKEEQRHEGQPPGPTAAQRLAALRRRIAARRDAHSGEAEVEDAIRDARTGGAQAAGALPSNEDAKMHFAPAALPRPADGAQRVAAAAAAAASDVAWHAVDLPPRAD